MNHPKCLYEALCITEGPENILPMTDEEVAQAAYRIFGGTVSMDEIRRAIKDMIREANGKTLVS